MADAAAALLDYLEIKRANIVKNANSGAVVQTLSIHDPESTATLISIKATSGRRGAAERNCKRVVSPTVESCRDPGWRAARTLRGGCDEAGRYRKHGCRLSAYVSGNPNGQPFYGARNILKCRLLDYRNSL